MIRECECECKCYLFPSSHFMAKRNIKDHAAYEQLSILSWRRRAPLPEPFAAVAQAHSAAYRISNLNASADLKKEPVSYLSKIFNLRAFPRALAFWPSWMKKYWNCRRRRQLLSHHKSALRPTDYPSGCCGLCNNFCNKANHNRLPYDNLF